MKHVITFLCALLWATTSFAATLLPNGEQQFVDQNGKPYAGGSVYFYIPSTTTPKATYKDSGATILNINPVTLDAAGRAIIYGTGVYRQVLKDANGNTIWDQLTADTASTQVSYAGTSSGTPNEQTITALNFSNVSGQIISFRAGLTNTGAFSIIVNGFSGISVLKDTISGPVNLAAGDITINNNVSMIYDATLGAFHLIAYPALSQGGGALSGQLDMNGNKIINLGTPTLSTDAVTKAYADLFLPLAGGTMSGNINANTHTVINLVNPPINTLDAAPKGYVDDKGVSARTSVNCGGGPSTSASYNVSSVGHPTTGHYTVNFVNSLPNPYVVSITGGLVGGNPLFFAIDVKSSSNVTILSTNNVNSATDCSTMDVVVFGGQ